MAKRKPTPSTKATGPARVRKLVDLDPVTPDDAAAAVADIESLCEYYGISRRDRDAMWAAYACFCTHLLLRNGELPGPE